MTFVRVLLGALLAMAGVLAGAFTVQATAVLSARHATEAALVDASDRALAAESAGHARGLAQCVAAADSARAAELEAVLARTVRALRALEAAASDRALRDAALAQEIDRVLATPNACPERPLLRALADRLPAHAVAGGVPDQAPATAPAGGGAGPGDDPPPAP